MGYGFLEDERVVDGEVGGECGVIFCSCLG